MTQPSDARAPVHALAPLRAVLPLRTRSPNLRAPNPFVAARAIKAQRRDAFVLIRHHLGLTALLAPAYRVTLTRLEVTARWMDYGNAIASVKALQDEVAAWLLVDDGDRARVQWVYAQRAAAPGEFGVEVTVEPLPARFHDPRRAT